MWPRGTPGATSSRSKQEGHWAQWQGLKNDEAHPRRLMPRWRILELGGRRHEVTTSATLVATGRLSSSARLQSQG